METDKCEVKHCRGYSAINVMGHPLCWDCWCDYCDNNGIGIEKYLLLKNGGKKQNENQNL